MRRSPNETNLIELGRAVRLSRIRPNPPRGLRYHISTKTLSWEAPVSERNITHYRVYTDTDTNLVRMVPVYQRFLQDNFSARRVFVTSYNLPLNLESSPAFLSQVISSPLDSIFHTAGFGIGEGDDLAGPAADVCEHWDITVDGTPFEAWANQADWPTGGADTIFDIFKRTPPSTTWASIFPTGSANKIVIPDGEIDPVTVVAFADGMSFTRGDQLRLDLIQGTPSKTQAKVLYR